MTDIAQTPEAIAYQLMSDIINRENGWENGRDYLLSTYADCRRATFGDYKSESEKGGVQPKVRSL
jgi:hypothetical protein